MKAPEIADRFQRSVDRFGDLRVRVLKLRALCERSGVSLDEVLTLLPADLRDQVRQA
jgi:hypothetical protein